jgi:ATP-dependent RNA helicase RhlE
MKIPIAHIPSGIEIAETLPEERKEMLRTIDILRRKADPTFKGAFHEKKWVTKAREAGKKVPIRRNDSFKKQAEPKQKNIAKIKKGAVGKKNPKKK